MIEDYFVTLFDVERNTRTETDMGSYSDSWAATLSDQLGCFRPLKMSAGEQVEHGTTEVGVNFILYCKIIAILEKDRIVSDSVYYDVKFVRNVMAFNHHLEVELKRIL